MSSDKPKMIIFQDDGETGDRLRVLAAQTRRTKSAVLRELVRLAVVRGPDLGVALPVKGDRTP